MKRVRVGEYEGYRHNAYDGLETSWSVLMALGGDGAYNAADRPALRKIIADEKLFLEAFNPEICLRNLDGYSPEKIQEELNNPDNRGKYTVRQWVGNAGLNIEFRRTPHGVIAKFVDLDGVDEYCIENLC